MRVPCEVAGPTKPRHLKRSLVILVVHLRIGRAARFAGLWDEFAAFEIFPSVCSGAVSLPCTKVQRIGFPPAPHVRRVARRAVSLALPFVRRAAAGTVRQEIDVMTALHWLAIGVGAAVLVVSLAALWSGKFKGDGADW